MLQSGIHTVLKKNKRYKNTFRVADRANVNETQTHVVGYNRITYIFAYL